MNPFVGLRPFREDERHLFMGRELASAYLETRSALNSLTLLFARSGIGKSSFLTSRVIPDLREEHEIVYVNEWGGKKPEAIFQEALDRLSVTRNGFDETSYLLLDQFEDVFKQDLDRSGLWDSLAEVVNPEQSDIRIVVTMREEWLGAWEEAEQYIPGAYSSIVRLAPLTEKELRRAITQPIEIEGQVKVEPGLVDALLQDLRQPNAFGLGEGFVEPGLLQLVCHRVWEEAAARSDHLMTRSLYVQLGGAQSIIQDFVWRHLRNPSQSKEVFTASQRLLWAGLVRHLSVAHGVKATVTPDMLARKVLMTDLGIAGPAIAAGKGLSVWRYLGMRVERRGRTPDRLTDWITETLDVAHSFGFLKRQQGYKASDPHARLYELSHDGLVDIFRTFSLEFEKWVARRVYTLQAIFAIIFILGPWFTIVVLNEGIAQALLILILFIIGGLVYLGILWILMKIYVYVAAIIYYPIVRGLVSGSIKPPKQS